MLSILVLTMSLNSVLGVQLLISVGKEKKYAIATTTGAIVNVLVNIISIPRYGVLGACISSILAECIVFIISFVHAKEYLNLKQIANDNLVSFISSVLMYIIVLMIKNVGIVIGLRLALEVIVGAGVYFIVMLISNNEVMRLIISKLRKRG